MKPTGTFTAKDRCGGLLDQLHAMLRVGTSSVTEAGLVVLRRSEMSPLVLLTWLLFRTRVAEGTVTQRGKTGQVTGSPCDNSVSQGDQMVKGDLLS